MVVMCVQTTCGVRKTAVVQRVFKARESVVGLRAVAHDYVFGKVPEVMTTARVSQNGRRARIIPVTDPVGRLTKRGFQSFAKTNAFGRGGGGNGGLNPLKRLFEGKGKSSKVENTRRDRVASPQERNITSVPPDTTCEQEGGKDASISTPNDLPIAEMAGNIAIDGGQTLASPEKQGPLLNWNLEELKLKEGLGFGFSAGGLLFPYFVGNAVALKRLGLITEDTVFAGSSAGSLISACLVCDLDPEMLMGANIEMYRELRDKGTIGNVRNVVETYAHMVLPDDAHIKAKDRLNVSIVNVKRQSPFLQPVYVNEFHSKEDLVQALLTSSHVPLYMNAKVTSTYRGRTCVDGGLGTNFIPLPPCTEPVTICCFPSMPFESDIAPGKYSQCDYSLRKMLKFAVLPPAEDKIVELFEMGVNDVLDWATHISTPQDNEQ